MPKAVVLGPNFNYLAFSMMIKQLRHIRIKAKYKSVNARFLDVIGEYTECQLPHSLRFPENIKSKTIFVVKMIIFHAHAFIMHGNLSVHYPISAKDF
ncbi:hypothetical protein D3C85_1731380 [compost metagenome]